MYGSHLKNVRIPSFDLFLLIEDTMRIHDFFQCIFPPFQPFHNFHFMFSIFWNILANIICGYSSGTKTIVHAKSSKQRVLKKADTYFKLCGYGTSTKIMVHAKSRQTRGS